jgi:hypothetical protein
MAIANPITSPTRRAILRGIAATAVSTAAVAIPSPASPSDDPNAVLAAWCKLKDLTVEWRRLDDEMWEIWSDLPEWARKPKVLLLVGKYSGDQFYASSADEIERYYMNPASPWYPFSDKVLAEKRAKIAAKVAELQEIEARADAERERTGWAWRDQRQDEIDTLEAQYHQVIDKAIGAHPVIIAAKLWQALYFTSTEKYFDDYPLCSIVGAIRGLLPDLPAEMRATMHLIAHAEPTTTMVDVERELALAA